MRARRFKAQCNKRGCKRDRLDPARGHDARRLFATFAAAVAIFLPLRAWQAHEFIHPFAQASRAIARIPADVVLVDNVNAWRVIRLVRNEPDLAGPLTLPLAALTEAQIQDLCARHTVAVFSASDIARQGVRLESWEGRRAVGRAPPCTLELRAGDK